MSKIALADCSSNMERINVAFHELVEGSIKSRTQFMLRSTRVSHLSLGENPSTPGTQGELQILRELPALTFQYKPPSTMSRVWMRPYQNQEAPRWVPTYKRVESRQYLAVKACTQRQLVLTIISKPLLATRALFKSSMRWRPSPLLDFSRSANTLLRIRVESPAMAIKFPPKILHSNIAASGNFFWKQKNGH